MSCGICPIINTNLKAELAFYGYCDCRLSRKMNKLSLNNINLPLEGVRRFFEGSLH